MMKINYVCVSYNQGSQTSLLKVALILANANNTRSQAVARIADRTALQQSADILVISDCC